MLTVKIEAKGTNREVVTSIGVSESELEDQLGKELYAIEQLGYPFTTAEVYDQSLEGYRGLALRWSFQKVFENDTVKVSIKKSSN